MGDVYEDYGHIEDCYDMSYMDRYIDEFIENGERFDQITDTKEKTKEIVLSKKTKKEHTGDTHYHIDKIPVLEGNCLTMATMPNENIADQFDFYQNTIKAEKNQETAELFKFNLYPDGNKVADWLNQNHTHRNPAKESAVLKLKNLTSKFFMAHLTQSQTHFLSLLIINKSHLSPEFLNKKLGINKFQITKKQKKAFLAKTLSKLLIWLIITTDNSLLTILRH